MSDANIVSGLSPLEHVSHGFQDFSEVLQLLGLRSKTQKYGHMWSLGVESKIFLIQTTYTFLRETNISLKCNVTFWKEKSECERATPASSNMYRGADSPEKTSVSWPVDWKTFICATEAQEEHIFLFKQMLQIEVGVFHLQEHSQEHE